MPARSKRQQAAAGADKARCDRGEAPKTFPSCTLAEEFAQAPGGTTKGLPERRLRDKSTRGSAPLSSAEITQGFRRLG